MEMLVLANKYLFTNLQTGLSNYVGTQLSVETFYEIYGVAYWCSIPALQRACLAFADENAQKIMELEEFDHFHVVRWTLP